MNKYGNIKSGAFDSKLEIDYAWKLEALKRAGEIKSWTRTERGSKDWPLVVNGKHICYIEPDFIVLTNLGTMEVHETKGFKTHEYIIKKKLFQALHPEIVFHEIYGSQWKGKKTRFVREQRREIQI